MLQIKKRSNNKTYSQIDGYQTANSCQSDLQTCQKVILNEAFARIKMLKASPKKQFYSINRVIYILACTDLLDLSALDE